MAARAGRRILVASTLLLSLASAGSLTLANTDPDAEQTAATEIGATLGIQLAGVLLSIALGTSLHRSGVLWLPESLVTTLVGAIIGVLCRYFLKAEMAAQLGFYSEVFTFILLPVLMFEAGFGLPVKPYKRNFWSILLFSVLGTLISTAAIAALMYGVGYAKLSIPLTIEESLSFASLLSATDPVATLSVFGALNVHSDLNSIVAGESMGNDAISIVLFRTFSYFVQTGTHIDRAGMVHAAISFSKVLGGSTAIGVGAGIFATLAFRLAYAPPTWLRVPAWMRCGVVMPQRQGRADPFSPSAVAARLAQLSSSLTGGGAAAAAAVPKASDVSIDDDALASAYAASSDDAYAAGRSSSSDSGSSASAGVVEDWGRTPASNTSSSGIGAAAGSNMALGQVMAVGNPFRQAMMQGGQGSIPPPPPPPPPPPVPAGEGVANPPADRRLRVMMAQQNASSAGGQSIGNPFTAAAARPTASDDSVTLSSGLAREMSSVVLQPLQSPGSSNGAAETSPATSAAAEGAALTGFKPMGIKSSSTGAPSHTSESSAAVYQLTSDAFGTPLAQTGALLFFAYGAYFSAEEAKLSGIVAAIIAGVAMQRYTGLLMDEAGMHIARALLRKIAVLCEMVIFFTIGLDVALYGSLNLRADFVAWAVAGCIVSRALNVFPLSALINGVAWCRKAGYRRRAGVRRRAQQKAAEAVETGGDADEPSDAKGGSRNKKDKQPLPQLSGPPIPISFQTVSFWAGLRGAIAYVSAVSFPGPHADEVLACTTAVIMTTIAVMGTTVVPLLNVLKVPYDRGDGPPAEPDDTADYVWKGHPGVLRRLAIVSELRLQKLLAGSRAFVVRYGSNDPAGVMRQQVQQRIAAAAAWDDGL